MVPVWGIEPQERTLNRSIMKNCPKCNTPHSKSGIFCCRSCANSRGKRTEEFKQKVRSKLQKPVNSCRNCGKPTTSSIKFYCSILCSDQYRTSHYWEMGTKRSYDRAVQLGSSNGKKSAAARVKRSKDEIKLFEMCTSRFKSYSNHIIQDGWDADIVLPDYKIAVMWNGPWHYRPMGIKGHSLLQVQNRDRIKTDLFTTLGWKVVIFRDDLFTPESAFKELVAMVEIRTHDLPDMSRTF